MTPSGRDHTIGTGFHPGKQLAGLVLCGGAATRMGRDKALIEIAGIPLVLRVAALMGQVADPVLLAPGRPGRLGELGYREVADAREGAGPLAGLAAGLDASPHRLVAVVGVDMPFASPQLMALLADLHAGEDAVVPVTESGVQPLHAVWATTALLRIRAALDAERFALHAVLQELEVRLVDRDEWMNAERTGRFAVNVNRAEDLRGLV